MSDSDVARQLGRIEDHLDRIADSIERLVKAFERNDQRLADQLHQATTELQTAVKKETHT